MKWAKTVGILGYLCASQGTKFHLLLLSLRLGMWSVTASYLCYFSALLSLYQWVLTQWLAAILCMIRGLILHNTVRTVVSSSYSYLHFNFCNVNQQNHQTFLFKGMSFAIVVSWEGAPQKPQWFSSPAQTLHQYWHPSKNNYPSEDWVKEGIIIASFSSPPLLSKNVLV